MPEARPPYPAEFRQRMVKPVCADRSPAQLSREFGVTAQSITNWVGQAAVDDGKPLPGKEGLTTAERQELVRLHRQLRPVQIERGILAKATTWFDGRSDATSTKSLDPMVANQADLPVHTMCRVLCVCASGIYAWRDRAPSPRRIANAVMSERRRQCRVARLVQEAGLHGISKRRDFTVINPSHRRRPMILSTAGPTPVVRTVRVSMCNPQ